VTDEDQLAAARRGDHTAFARVVDPHRKELLAHCYRMLGSTTDAEDALQDTLLAAWRGLPRFEGRSSLRSWLYTIATNACLRAIKRRPKRVLPLDYAPPADPQAERGKPLAESVWIQPFADSLLIDSATPASRYEEREAVELAFIAALQHLPATQRAVLILRDVLGFSARETADALAATSVSVDSALQRAHKTVEARLPPRTQQQTLRTLSDTALREIVEKFAAAWERADVDTVVSMLAEDVAFAMPPEATWFAGRVAVAAFLAAVPLAADTPRHRLVPTWANGQVAFAHYSWHGDAHVFVRHGISVVSLRGIEITEIVTFRDREAFAGFDLPRQIPAGVAGPFW
jgi:RNA polymerase sigma-70 factor, ECF subfamily